jgi:hypothetical protein
VVDANLDAKADVDLRSSEMMVKYGGKNEIMK